MLTLFNLFQCNKSSKMPSERKKLLIKSNQDWKRLTNNRYNINISEYRVTDRAVSPVNLEKCLESFTFYGKKPSFKKDVGGTTVTFIRGYNNNLIYRDYNGNNDIITSLDIYLYEDNESAKLAFEISLGHNYKRNKECKMDLCFIESDMDRHQLHNIMLWSNLVIYYTIDDKCSLAMYQDHCFNKTSSDLEYEHKINIDFNKKYGEAIENHILGCNR